MNKALTLILVLIVITAQLAFLSCFHSTSQHNFAWGTSAIVVSKADFVYLRVHITINPTASQAMQNNSVILQFSDGSQKEIVGKYSFEASLSRTGNHAGGFGISHPSMGIELSTLEPVHFAVISNIADNFTDRLAQIENEKIDIYWVKIQGHAGIEIKSYSLGI